MSNLRCAFLSTAMLVCIVFAWSCGGSSQPQAGGATNWLASCDADKDCGVYGACMCGICSEDCAEDADCGAGLVCKAVDSSLVRDACGATAKSGLCAPKCKRDSDCDDKQKCIESACTPGASGRTPQAYVLSALLPDSSCTYALDNPIEANGLMDIATSGNGGDACKHDYRVRLKVASEEPGVLQLMGATVTLMDQDQNVLKFATADPPLPNPFTYVSSMTALPAAGGETTTTIFEVEVVRAAHAPYLSAFDGKAILASITVQALDKDDAPVTFRPFVYPITICDGCLTRCLHQDVLDEMLQVSDVLGDHCDDNSGTDDRICIDPDC